MVCIERASKLLVRYFKNHVFFYLCTYLICSLGASNYLHCEHVSRIYFHCDVCSEYIFIVMNAQRMR
jgi:hypothetical protein